MAYKKRLAITLSGYIALMIAFAFYWGNYSLSFVHMKGDDFTYCVIFDIIISYAFLAVSHSTIRRMNFILIFFVPLFLMLLSLLVGFFVLMLFHLPGTPKQINIIYTITYLVLLLIAITIIWGVQKKLAIAK